MSAAWQASHKEGTGSGVSRAQDRPLLWEGSPWSRRHWWSVQHWRNAELSPKPTWGGSVWAEQGPNLHRGRAFRWSWRMSRRWPGEEIQGGHGSQAFKIEATGRVQAAGFMNAGTGPGLTTIHLVWFKLHCQEKAKMGDPSSAFWRILHPEFVVFRIPYTLQSAFVYSLSYSTAFSKNTEKALPIVRDMVGT